MKFRKIFGIGILIAFVALIALAAHASNLNTSGKCPTGACSIGDSTRTSSFTVNTDGTGDGEVVLPDDSIGSDEIGTSVINSGHILGGSITASDMAVNSVEQAEFSGVPVDQLIFCGPSCSTSTCAGGHNPKLLAGDYSTSSAMASTDCDALGETSIAAASEAVSADNAFKVHGMYCVVNSSGSNGVVLALTAADAATVPAVTCTIATGETSCAAETATTTNVAAAAVSAVSIATTEDLSGSDFICRVAISWAE